MTKTAPISKAGLRLIKGFEGYRPKATLLPNGHWVIGHGHTASAREGAQVNPNDAETLLLWDMKQLAPKLKSCIFAPISQPQMDGLLSLAFNIGIENFSGSDVVRYLNEGNLINAAGAFDVWRRGKIGERVMVIDALVRRRAAEKALFLDVEGSVVPAPSALLHPEFDQELNSWNSDRAEVQELPSSDEVTVSIDLDQSGALGSVLQEVSGFAGDTDAFGHDPSVTAEPAYVYSDDDELPTDDAALEESAANDHGTDEDETTKEQTPGEDLVKLGDVFGQENPTEIVREVAEKISGRMAKIAVETTDPELPPVEEDFRATLASETEVEAAEKTKDLPISPRLEDDLPQEEMEEAAHYVADEDVELPPQIDHVLPTPENLSTEMGAVDEPPFEVQERRNTGMFVLMGIVGIILTMGGIYEIQKSGVVVTLWDMVRGPGTAGFGLLLALVALYFLMKRVFR